MQACVADGDSLANCRAAYASCFRICTNEVRNEGAELALTPAPVRPIHPAISREARLTAVLKAP
ncbi:hypothetical protein [Dyella tabacisoli]|uniref:Uncharacterized protein n=1 Tax=Dyella tabacisoli TaxID=2282381 RepID=A0A369UH10_9GAMM|nr:hypothetical protein [Dyella tabacisoli]RDD79826.1 hypothetical protein DVJ77_20400 [Dyella tabacisoli]